MQCSNDGNGSISSTVKAHASKSKAVIYTKRDGVREIRKYGEAASSPASARMRMGVCDSCDMVVHVYKQCSRCMKAIYCSRECQTAAWPQHKKVCVKKTTVVE